MDKLDRLDGVNAVQCRSGQVRSDSDCNPAVFCSANVHHDAYGMTHVSLGQSCEVMLSKSLVLSHDLQPEFLADLLRSQRPFQRQRRHTSL